MSKLKEFAEFLLEVSKVGVYDRREDEDEDWVTFTANIDSNYQTYLTFNEFESGDLRLKPKEEEKKKIPLEACDITFQTIFMNQNISFSKYIPVCISEKGVTFCYDSEGYNYPYNEKLFRNWQYSTDNGKTWKGCYKYED